MSSTHSVLALVTLGLLKHSACVKILDTAVDEPLAVISPHCIEYSFPYKKEDYPRSSLTLVTRCSV